MKLYYVPNTRATRPRWLLEELGVPYELVRLDVSKGQNKEAEYRAIHPLGSVPALVDGDVSLIESAAICMYLADKYPEKKLAPPVGTQERALYYQEIMFAMATLEPPLVQTAMHSRFLPEEKRSPALLADNQKRLNDVLGVLEKKVDGRKFLVGDSFTAADVVLGGLANMIKRIGVSLEGFPALAAYFTSLTERPAFKRAFAD